MDYRAARINPVGVMATVHALELSFDPHNEQRLSSLWRDLATAYDKIGEGVVGVRPHVSLAVFAGERPGDPSALVARLARLKPFSIALDEVDVFAGHRQI